MSPAPHLALDHVVIAVSDWERSNTFYAEVLGAEVIELTRGRWAYRFANTQLNVHGPGSTPEPIAAAQAPPGAADLCFVWDGPIDGAVEHLEARNVAVERGPIERHGRGGPGVSVYFRDPDGSLLELISYSS